MNIDEKTFQLSGRRVFFVGVGKCAIASAVAVEKVFGERLTGGIAFDVSGRGQEQLQKIEVHVGTHPLPTDENERATERILAFLAATTPEDLVLFVISGGGSTLLCLHAVPMTCLDESDLFRELTSKGAPIQELNTVRKHLSAARGGGLAKAAYPAEVLALIISDVPGNNLEFIASGPTVRDDSTVANAGAVLARYGIPANPQLMFVETPKEEKYFERVSNILFLTSHDALLAMQSEATRLGYAATIADEKLCGEARELAGVVVEKLRSAPPHSALLYAGESTVTLPANPGKGGRNQEFALAALSTVGAGELILPFASDGTDDTDHAGAIADELTRAHAEAKSVSIADALAAHRSYDFFSATGDFIDTGQLESNVSDLLITLKN